MDRILPGSRIAIVGGGKFCKTLLETLHSIHLRQLNMHVVGIADIDDRSPGIVFAADNGIFTCSNYRELLDKVDYDIVLELTNDDGLSEKIRKIIPENAKLIDHFEAILILELLQIQEEKSRALGELQGHVKAGKNPEVIFREFAGRIEDITRERILYSLNIERNLLESERATTQIIQGSTIPTFVLDRNHVVTHWNKALEALTGVSAKEMVGTKKAAFPFWGKERPSMADVILDQIQEDEIEKLYEEKWRKSVLIEDGYEAEVFFPRLGENGKWCLFTAAPIRSPDGSIIGAIETLWDRTEDKLAEEERKRHNRELEALCSIYSALNAPMDIDYRINSAAREILNFLDADEICVFLKKNGDGFQLKYCFGAEESRSHQDSKSHALDIVKKTAEARTLLIVDDISELEGEEICSLRKRKTRSLVYIPITAKGKNILGIIRIGSRVTGHFSHREENVLELIGNRIGASVENALLQEQYIKSEKKYRSLFNNDPNPIFILHSESLKILDINKRTEDYYGYLRHELLGLSFSELGDDSSGDIIRKLKNLRSDRSAFFSKKRHYRKDRHPFYVNINVNRAKYGERDVLIATTTDVTESVEKETQLIQASKMTTLGLMAAGVAHEINQPLNVIQICADYFQKMIRKGKTIAEEELVSLSKDISANVTRATKIIKHMRDFARQSDVVKTRVNINDPIQDVFKVLGHRLKVHQIELDLGLSRDMLYILAEHNRLEQVFINLVSNAIDAMDEKDTIPEYKGTPKKLKIRSFSENGNVVVIVADTGMGMSREVMEKIFEPFFTTKEIGKGTGLGISISYGIVKDYEGKIQVESEIGKGTSFKLIFPAWKKSD